MNVRHTTDYINFHKWDRIRYARKVKQRYSAGREEDKITSCMDVKKGGWG